MRKQRYKDIRDSERAAREAAGIIAERYPAVSHIDCHMIYYRRGINPILLKRTLSFTPADYAGFHLKCMDEGCADGGFDLAPVVAAMVKGRKRSASGKIFCHGTNDTAGHASMGYEVKIAYAKA